MGYTTEFVGSFTLDKPLIDVHRRYLQAFANTRRMKRNEYKVGIIVDCDRESAGLPIGVDGCYFVNGSRLYDETIDDSVIDINTPPSGQPGLWCQWEPVINDAGDAIGIGWNGAEKFYNYIEWLDYIINHFIRPWGYVLDGAVEWSGEDPSDLGRIVVRDNQIMVQSGTVVYT